MTFKPPYYLAPEAEKESGKADEWLPVSDVFSLGICQAEFLAQSSFWVESLDEDADLMHPLKVTTAIK